MRQRDWLILGMLYLAFCARPSASAAPALPEHQGGATDERMLQPGVYWYCCSPAEAQEFMNWVNDRTLIADSVTLLGSNGVDCAVVLFRLNGAAYWTLTGLPKLAPNGLATTLDQLKGEPTLLDFFLRKAEQTIEAVRRMDARIQQWLDSIFR